MTKEDLQLLKEENFGDFYLKNKVTGDDSVILNFEELDPRCKWGSELFGDNYEFTVEDYRKEGADRAVKITMDNISDYELIKGSVVYPPEFDFYPDDYSVYHCIDVFTERDGKKYCITYCGSPIPKDISRNENQKRQDEVLEKISNEEFIFSEEDIISTIDEDYGNFIEMARLGYIVGMVDENTDPGIETIIAWPKGYYTEN